MTTAEQHLTLRQRLNRANFHPEHHTEHVADERKYGDHFLTKTELRNVASVNCLQAKQHNPRVSCDGARSVPSLTDLGEFGRAQTAADMWSGELGAGNFPNYQDPACNSGGEYLCDPHGLLSEDERNSLATKLKTMREDNLVTCGRLLNDTVDNRHKQPFYLGVAIVRDWPLSQSGPESLQQAGQIISAQWNMNRAYVGSLRPYTRCPNVGVLIILVNNRQTYLSTESCEFICQDHGATEAMTASQLGLRESPLEAATAGIDSVYRFLGDVHETNSTTVLSDSVQSEKKQEKRASDIMTLTLRVLYALAIVMVIFSFLVASSVAYFGSGRLMKKRGF
eukprot:TRINITY_DN18769_c0_g1_i1.p1 TRINITY_DN18769_c0_g1~~TRINITY_DN18769_c0_g1_i1.p1  ORF type:complete len:388 (+),score=42.20 TRINITY_DN18769_c0_g1_i1:156-1166(+)